MRDVDMRLLLLAGLVVAAASVAPAQADVYDNKTLPIYFRTPEGFPIRPATVPGYDLVLRINPTGNFPRRAAGEDFLCEISWKSVPSQQARTQQWLNDRWTDEAVMTQALGAVAAIMQVKSDQTFTMADVAGKELIGPMRNDPSTVVVMSVANTPRGRVQMLCMLQAAEAEAALPVLRSIRDTIRPPK
jgi:hypothetical protein